MIAKMLFGIGFVCVLFLLYCVYLYTKQDVLLFYGVRNDAGLVALWEKARVEIPVKGGFIEGWSAEYPENSAGPVLIYFGGNAEDVLRTAGDAAQFGAARVFFSNYRGYGGTPGKASQQALFSDALAIYDYVIKQPGVAADTVFVMGRSLGSGVATYLASQRPVRGAVLVTPYDSMEAVARAHYSYAPVRWLLRNKFPADEYARKTTVPVQIIAAEDDIIVPAVHARRLYEVWAGPKHIHVLRNAGHNDVQQHARYFQLIRSFLAERD